ncbi:MAG: tRNA 2-thiouridine(34) synthase MnmA [Oscillospiraceae bacterium]|nr:tRNA 2-thiouridine(34) synthase MnmA [Oscillospiraceae bacterium]
MSRIVLGFSGGVDSAVSAALLKKDGHEVVGLYLDNGGEDAKRSAEENAAYLGIELMIADVKDALEKCVCAPFTDAYLRGETPNPCIICNPAVKFKLLLETADRVGAERIATGHYARAENGAIYRGRPSNDQSYMLCRLTREQAARAVFPLGTYEKTQTRAMASDMKLPAASRPDSQEICFIPDNDYRRWLAERAGEPEPGDLSFHGAVIGRHEGIVRYTVGQRIPGLFDGRKLYVSRIDARTRTVELALWEELFRTEVRARDFSWLIDPPAKPIRASVKVRHTKWENPPCTVTQDGGIVRIVCDEPVRAPAAGQSAVLYDGDRLLGGGFIIQT